MLTADELTAMQATQNQAMPGTVYILRVSGSADGMGGYTETWGTVGTVTGRIYPTFAGNERVSGEQPISATSWWGTFPVGTSITAKDRVRYSGRTWEVDKVNNSEMWQTAVRCGLTALNEENRT